jgi:L-ascorbate metabolism protein UlaG (beta-lactamase superfamily)
MAHGGMNNKVSGMANYISPESTDARLFTSPFFSLSLHQVNNPHQKSPQHNGTMSTFNGNVSITHITTATAIINIDGVRFLTDPVFCPAGSEYVYDGWSKAPNLGDFGFEGQPPPGILRSFEGPALLLHDIPPIDAVLLSHEDHVDNLDPLGRQLLDGRHVFTTPDGAHNLQPRPGVVGIRPWQTVSARLGGKDFYITGTPCKHFPGGEVTGFIVECDSFGVNEAGLPNVVYFSGDTVWIDELAEIKNKWHVSVAVLNLGNALFEHPKGVLQITFDGKQAAHLMRVLNVDQMVPIHFESWEHFTEHQADLAKVFDDEKVSDKVFWLTPGEETPVVVD